MVSFMSRTKMASCVSSSRLACSRKALSAARLRMASKLVMPIAERLTMHRMSAPSSGAAPWTIAKLPSVRRTQAIAVRMTVR